MIFVKYSLYLLGISHNTLKTHRTVYAVVGTTYRYIRGYVLKLQPASRIWSSSKVPNCEGISNQKVVL